MWETRLKGTSESHRRWDNNNYIAYEEVIENIPFYESYCKYNT